MAAFLATESIIYSDPVDAFLKENNYEDQKPLDKLKILVDGIEHLSIQTPSLEDIFQDKLDALQSQIDALPVDKGQGYVEAVRKDLFGNYKVDLDIHKVIKNKPHSLFLMST